jgi:septal ring factor EnvC (AmiA/AmiB activator)
MTEEVVANVAVESTTSDVQDNLPVSDESTQGTEDITTWKKRLAGKDQALTATKKDLDDAKRQLEELSKFKAQIEEQSMSEYDKAQNRIKALEGEITSSREQAKRERLAREYPLYNQLLQDTAGLDEDSRAAAFERFIADARTVSGEETTSLVDPNNPRRSEPKVNTKRDASAIADELKSLGNPFFE